MSGFEMHCFRSIDRPLSQQEMKEIDSWSSRFSPSSSGINYVYHYSSFGQDADTIFPKYFDAMLYFDSWGTKQFMFRFPKSAVNWKELTQFTNVKDDIHLDFKKVGDYITLELYFSDDEDGGWMEEEDYLLDALIPIRDEIMRGDYRSLFIGWMIVQKQGELWEEEDEPQEEISTPAIPANLNKLTAAQQYLVKMFGLDQGFVDAAATFSPNSKEQQIDYSKLIPLLSSKEKDEYLLKIIQEKPRIEIELRNKLQELSGGKSPITNGQSASWDKLVEISQQKNKAAAEAYAEEQSQLHIQQMESLISQKEQLWEDATVLLQRTISSHYDRATEILCQLKAVAEYEKQLSAFQKKLSEWIISYKGRKAFMGRLREKGLIVK